MDKAHLPIFNSVIVTCCHLNWKSQFFQVHTTDKDGMMKDFEDIIYDNN